MWEARPRMFLKHRGITARPKTEAKQEAPTSQFTVSMSACSKNRVILLGCVKCDCCHARNSKVCSTYLLFIHTYCTWMTAIMGQLAQSWSTHAPSTSNVSIDLVTLRWQPPRSIYELAYCMTIIHVYPAKGQCLKLVKFWKKRDLAKHSSSDW